MNEKQQNNFSIKNKIFINGFFYAMIYLFFIELVPYLPSYGGYVRYVVGLILLIFSTKYLIKKINLYYIKKKNELSLSQQDRINKLKINKAKYIKQCIKKSLCPSCENVINLKEENLFYCPHCGLKIFNNCSHCNTKNNVFENFCKNCGKNNI